jgi:CheY-like chemotaxis protein
MPVWNILVVDDEREIRDVIAEYLEALGHRVTAVSSGKEALEDLASERANYDVALVDWSMPGISGRDVIRDIARRTPKTVVLITTGYMPAGMEVRHIEGIDAHVLHKPFSLSDLRAKIKEISTHLTAG